MDNHQAAGVPAGQVERPGLAVPAPQPADGPLSGLTLEAREKLARIRPRSLGQAGRIPGVSPSDLAQLSIALAAAQKQSEKEAPHDR